jgi:hypothetical protein
MARKQMATTGMMELIETYIPEMIEEFGGPQELLLCLESLSQKLHGTHKDAPDAEGKAQ